MTYRWFVVVLVACVGVGPSMASRASSPGGHGAESWEAKHPHSRNPDRSQSDGGGEGHSRGAAPDLVKAFSDGWRYGTAPDMTSLPLDTLTAVVEAAHRAEPGKLADLVPVDGRPHESIGHITRIDAVWLGGREVDRARLKQALASERPMPLPSSPAAAGVDDFERQDGRATGGPVWVDYTDSGHDRSRLSWTRTAGSTTDHAVLAYARLGVKKRPVARLTLRFAAGGLLSVDAHAFRGVGFDVRGDGSYHLLLSTRSAGRAPWRADFSAGPAWTRVRMPFSRLKREAPTAEWDGTDLVSLAFELTGRGGQQRWMEIDNVAFYR